MLYFGSVELDINPVNTAQGPEASGLPAQKRENKTEPLKQQATERQRVSMRKKLKEKKAEIARRDSKPPKQSKAAKPHGMGVDD